MDKCHYYLSAGLWKIVGKYFDSSKKLDNEFFWSIAVHPNYHSFGSHIISTPWQQSWMTMNILESSLQDLKNSKDVNIVNSVNFINILRKEIDFQFSLRNYSLDPFVQQLFSIYSKIQSHLLINFSEIELKLFNSNFKALLNVLLKECPSTAHTLLNQMLQHGIFVTSCETLLHEAESDDLLCNLVISSLCETDSVQFHIPYIVGLLQTSFRYNFSLLLLASDNISFLCSMIEEDRKLIQSNSRMKLELLLDKGMQPLSCFSDMTIMERHFLLQILDLINFHLKEFSNFAKCPNIPNFIWPIILLQNWNNPSLSDELLLQLIERCKESTKDKIITQITYILEWYISFCKWYDKQETSGIKEKSHENKKVLLEKAKEHSVLYLINNTTDLSETDWLQIQNLLQQRNSRVEDIKSWDLILFDGYCILMLILRTIILSVEIDQIVKLQKIKLDNISLLNEFFLFMYNEEVTENLKKVKAMLQLLYPLSFRLEILENIFALIFITYEDVKKLSYFVNGSLDLEKYLEKAQMKNKLLIETSDISNSCKIFNLAGAIVKFSDLTEEEINKKYKLKGFICKKYIVRDLIYLVKECLEKLEEDPGVHSKNPGFDVPCSIKNIQMENRLDRLLESVSEATWRLQLVTDPDFVSQIGTMQFACGQDPYHHFDGEWIYLPHDSDRSVLLKTRKKSADKPNESGSQSNSSPGNGASSNEYQSPKHKNPGPAIMNQMLACDSSLVVQCLSQGDVLNADHIIQMMSTVENRQNLEGELNFTRAINDLKTKLQNISLESPVRKTGIDSVSKSKSLQSIQMIANQGVNSTALTNHVERFLSAYTLPSIQSHSKVSAGSVLQCIENTTAMVTIDLALTTSMTFQDFKDLLNIASKHCPELSTRVQSPISAQTTSTKPLGYIVFSQNMIALLQEINRSQISDNNIEISPQQFLRGHLYPFSLKSLKDNINFWKHLKLAFSDFEKNTEESQSLLSCREGLLAKCRKNIKEMQNIFESVTKLAESCAEFMDLGKLDISGGEISKNVNYCELLSRYLSDLSIFILENVSVKTDELPEPISLHNLLEQSAVEIVDKLIFDHHIEPGVLEKKAQQLGFNLSASLIAGCCPRLPQIFSSLENSKCPPSDRIILNELVPGYKSLSPLNPNEVVENILSELLIAFRTYAQNKQGDENGLEIVKNHITESDIFELRNDIKIQKILEKTLEVNFVDLKSLNESEIIVFFINLLNIMMCHCYLYTKLENTDGIYSKYYFNCNVAFAFLGYNVGDLGFVSIADIKQRIFGTEWYMRLSIRHEETWNWLQVSADPRLVFMTTNFRYYSPPLLLIYQNSYDTQVNDGISNYVQATVSVEDDQVIISDLLENYLNNVILNQCTENFSLSEDGSIVKMKLLLKFLIEYSSKELQEQLSNLSPSGTSLKILRNPHEVMLKLDYSTSSSVRMYEDKQDEKWLDRHVTDSILRHFSQSSRVLADIVQKIHEAKEPPHTEVARDVLTEEKLKYLDLLFSTSWVQHASPLFYKNTVITALSKYPNDQNLVEFFENCVEKKDWTLCLNVLFALPDYFVFSNLNVKRFKDLALREAVIMASERGKHNSWLNCDHISEVNIRIETIMTCCKYWPGSVCCSLLSCILRDNPFLPSQQQHDIKSLTEEIKIYNTILGVASDLDAKIWFDVRTIANASPDMIIKSLVKISQLELCLQWISLPGILNSILQFIDSDFIYLFFEHLSQEVDLIDQLVDSLPNDKLIEIYKQVIFQLNSVSSISHLVQRAIKLDPSPQYRMVEISLKFLFLLDSEEQSRLVHLISHPLLIIEQLLMNMKLDCLEKIFKKARQIDEEDLISQNEIKELIIFYASKAVELDLVKVKAVKNSEVKQPFLLGTYPQINQEEMIPSEVPEKSQWVPDNTVSLCMCCRLVSFSMFNRRHHCRRCGRVVCGTCSIHRMKVAGYRGVAVRVCQSCYLHQAKIDSDTKCSQSVDTLDGSSFTQDVHYWKLSTDPSRNATIRDEFIYDHSPNVTLCLAIFNLLPDATYSSVLIDESEKMLKILQLNGKSDNPEVDCGVLIQIIRSLIVGAKVRYGRGGLMSEVDCCDQLLSQVDLLQLLINNHCSRLIPSEPLSGVTLRFLRDKLVEEELWELAMEVSTKCGLDRNGVWAAWGKVCLAAGSWEEARIKFSHCLTSSPKPSRNPPLLEEICRILEYPTAYVNLKPAQKITEKNVEPQEVLQLLATLKPLSQGKSLPLSTICVKNSVQYEEEIYYLTTYGSHQALLQFYLKHDELKIALSYLLQQQLEPDLFTDCLLLPSYKLNQHEKFKSILLSIDPSLESFKKYLSNSCVYLQRASYLNTLYDLQIFMQDYLRAAVTCIHLYQENAVNFTDLVSRSNHLHNALRHLEEELTSINKKTKRLDCIMKMEPKMINRHMNTIWRQLESAKFLAACESKDKFTVKDIFPNEIANEDDIPTLFDGIPEKTVLVKMIIVLGRNISEGFGIAFRIMQDHQLDSQSIYIGIGKKLAEESRLNDLEALIDCLKTSGAEDINSTIDEMISVSIPILAQNGTPFSDLEPLSKLIKNLDLRINAFIETRQLVPAYILAVKRNRLNDIQKIMEVADQHGQTIMKKICLSKLNQSNEMTTHEDRPGFHGSENE